MLWADRIASEIQDTRKPRNGKTFLIRDEKTISGRVHVGSMRGVAIHGLVAEVLAENGVASEFRFEIGDLDPFDSIPNYLDTKKFTEHLGKPLFAVPSPESGFKNYAEYFGEEFIGVHKKAGFIPNYYRATDFYRSGKMDTLVKVALERANDIRRILREVSGSEKDVSWLPVSVICEKCGKMMTTRAYGYDGETVGYACDKNPDECVPCGHTGRIAPWRGAAKLFWKVDWAAKWVAQGVDIEGGGKDHSTRGGSRDAANHISREVFGYEPPFDIPYEFFLVGGKKMSSSKGRGSSAKDMSDLFPPQTYRLALIGKDIREQINIDPSGESVPRLYDWHDELALGVREGKADDYSRLYALCELPKNRAALSALWQMRFREVAFIAQMPHLSLEDEAARAKGSALTADERIALEERARYAKFWLTAYAPEEFKYELQEEMPNVNLSNIQKKALGVLAEYLQAEKRTGEELHLRLHELKTEVPIQPKDLFQAMYRIFLVRDSGPKAGWFLAGLPRNFVIKRLKEASQQ
ncbi:lysine--tRNA ligase [Candidatus Kaiserbacteria bacterium]|uniref:Lysine--tRNA ligase n=1 Tax=Candidatus Sungiibacteriota bacterium TaxID=2750080 RepID=A0A931SAX9_9BACT|nr:lysine--tRNA ligase [Candidatus Sungbacteria bacterium]MBI4088744.1 lysine--tRNA ligase [Candidatus Kaiserbacteria bacterium]